MSENIKDDVLLRLKTIKGHIAGIEKMVEENKACPDVLLQIAAVRSSLEKVGLYIVNEHAQECMMSSKDGKISFEDMEGIIKLLEKFLK